MTIDRRRFTRVFEEHFATLCRFLEGMLGDWSLAQDVAQDVFVRLLRVGLDVVEPGEERFWIYRVGRNLALNERARRERRQRLSRHMPPWFSQRKATPHDELEKGESLERLDRLLAKLPEPHRVALLLREQGDLSYREIAGVLGVSENKVKVDIFRARTALRARWRTALSTRDEVSDEMPRT